MHVSEKKFHDYLCSEFLGDCVDSNPKVAEWIHACSWKEENQKAKLAKVRRLTDCHLG